MPPGTSTELAPLTLQQVCRDPELEKDRCPPMLINSHSVGQRPNSPNTAAPRGHTHALSFQASLPPREPFGLPTLTLLTIFPSNLPSLRVAHAMATHAGLPSLSAGHMLYDSFCRQETVAEGTSVLGPVSGQVHSHPPLIPSLVPGTGAQETLFSPSELENSSILT